MKRIYQLLSLTVISGLLTVTSFDTANAQRRGGGGGGGGGSAMRGGGGGGGFHGGGGFSGGRSGGNFGGAPRMSAPRMGGFSGGGGRVMSAPRSNFGISPRNGGFNGRAGIAPRSNFGYRGGIGGGRPGFGTGMAYRTRPGYYRPGMGFRPGSRGYYGGRAYFRPWRGGYYYHGGFYGRYYAPRLGFSIGVLPYGYIPFWWGSDQYFYSGGYFYNYDNDQYTVVEPPLGAEIAQLPSGAQSIVIDGQQYYELNGVYYLPVTKDDGSLVYQIAGKDGQLSTGAADPYATDDSGYYPDQGQGQQQMQQDQGNILQPGEVVQALPPNCRKVKIDGEKYYVDPAGIYYHEERDQNGQKVYRVTDVGQDNY